MTDTETPTGLREQYAAAIASYDHAVGLASDPAPRGHHYGQADAVLAVRDRELEQVRAEVQRVRDAIHVADNEDVTDWQRGYRACSERALNALDPQEQS